MRQNQNQDTTSNMTQPAAQPAAPSAPAQQTSGGSKNLLILLGIVIVIAIVAIVLIVLYVLPSGGGLGAPAVSTLGHSAIATPSYLTISQSQELLGPSVSGYEASDLFNLTNPVNITLLDQIAPFIAGNSSSGWFTQAYVQNSTVNTTIQFFVLQSNNTAEVSNLMANETLSFFNETPSSTTGSYNGFDYTYQTFSNSSGNQEILNGWKNGDIALVVVSSQGLTVNSTRLINITAADTP